MSSRNFTAPTPDPTPPPPTTTPDPTPPPPTTTPDPTPDPTPPPPSTPDCTTHATPSTFAKAISAAAGGSTVCLAAGDYGEFAGASKTSLVTIKPETGASVAMSLKLDAGTSNIRFDGISDLGGWVINGSKNVQITNSTITYPTSVLGATPGLVFDHDTFDGLPAGTWEGRLSFANGASGAVVKNSHFGNGGCSDGIQFTGNSHDVLVQGNEFSNLHQGACAAHVDPIQFYGASNVTIDSNYFHDTSTGIMTPDGNGSPFTITRNVFVSSGDYPWAIVDGGGRNDVIDHNTIVGWTVEVGQANGGQNASNETVSNNVLPGITILSPQPASGVNDTGNFTGTPTFVGGDHPTTYGGYKATNTSAGI
jgi:hypothetical protein